MEEVKRLREQAKKAQKFAQEDPTQANKQRFHEVASAYELEADAREQTLAAQSQNTGGEE